jgi:hypothetical protein
MLQTFSFLENVVLRNIILLFLIAQDELPIHFYRGDYLFKFYEVSAKIGSTFAKKWRSLFFPRVLRPRSLV